MYRDEFGFERVRGDNENGTRRVRQAVTDHRWPHAGQPSAAGARTHDQEVIGRPGCFDEHRSGLAAHGKSGQRDARPPDGERAVKNRAQVFDSGFPALPEHSGAVGGTAAQATSGKLPGQH